MNATTSVPLVDAMLWAALCERLRWLISIKCKRVFIDVDTGESDEYTLCLNLHRLQVPQHLTRVQATEQAVSAFAVLCSLAEVRWMDASGYYWFWKKLVTSPMMSGLENPDAGSKTRRISDSWRARGLCVELTFVGQTLMPDMVSVICGFSRLLHFDADQGEQTPRRFVRWGLSLRRCFLSPQHITAAHNALRVGQVDRANRLCRDGITLDLSYNELHEANLHAIADILEDHQCVRVDKLVFKKSFPLDHATLTSATYGAAFRRVATAALCTVIPQHKRISIEVVLSHNENIQASHVQALYEAAQHASRPLTRLAFDHSACSDPFAWSFITRLLFTAPPESFSTGFNLGLYGFGQPSATITMMFECLSQIVREAVPAAVNALAGGTTVTCRVRKHIQVRAASENPVPLELSPTDRLRVVGVDESRLYVAVSTSGLAGLTVRVAVAISDIGCLWIGESAVIQARFTGLALGKSLRTAPAPWQLDASVVELLQLVGPDLDRFALSHCSFDLISVATVLRCVETVKVLKLRSSNIEPLHLVQVQSPTGELSARLEYALGHGSVWDAVSDQLLRNLHGIDVSKCQLHSQSLLSLKDRLGHHRSTQLRVLHLETNEFDATGLMALFDVLRGAPALDRVVLSKPTLQKDGEAAVALVSELGRFVQNECLRLETKVAMVSVTESYRQLPQLAPEILSRILSFAERRTPREIIWV